MEREEMSGCLAGSEVGLDRVSRHCQKEPFFFDVIAGKYFISVKTTIFGSKNKMKGIF